MKNIALITKPALKLAISTLIAAAGTVNAASHYCHFFNTPACNTPVFTPNVDAVFLVAKAKTDKNTTALLRYYFLRANDHATLYKGAMWANGLAIPPLTVTPNVPMYGRFVSSPNTYNLDGYVWVTAD